MKTKTLLAELIGISLLITTGVVQAYEEGQRFARVGVAHIAPNDDSGDIGAFPGNGVSVDDETGVGISFSYIFRDQWGVELLAALPFSHDINAEGPALKGLGRIASTKQLPPTLLVNYYPQVSMAGLHPYIGAGLNYTTFFDEEASGSLEGALGDTDITLDDSFGLALQAGVDWDWRDNWFFNAALWYMQIDTKADIDFKGGPATGGSAGSTDVSVDIDPWVLMLGMGYRF